MEQSMLESIPPVEQEVTGFTLSDSVEQAVRRYLNNMNGQEITELYELVLSEMEAPMLACVMSYASNNQSKASQMLGLNRGTLRKKLKKYGLV